MTTIGSYEAKTHLPQFLKRAAKGERFLITNKGVPVAELGPPPVSAMNAREAIKKMKKLRKGVRLGDDLTIRDLIEEGRRF